MIRRILKGVAAPIGLALLSACANLNSIDRSTAIGENGAKAVHLDVQQRLLIVNKFGKYCAEPSPDAMAAYAAALGLAVGKPTKGSESASASGQSTSASIGLRTQSITLMRDALYRMCEAYANNAVDDVQVVTLLNRSQDLTAVILAVEQLTGAVAANQASLTGSSGANSYATALNNSKLFAEAAAHEARALKRLEESRAEQAAASEKLDAAEAALAGAKAVLAALEDASAEEDKIRNAKKELAVRSKLRDAAAATSLAADARLESNQRVYDSAQGVTAEIAKTPDSSSASSSSSTAGTSEFSTPTPAKALSKDATVAIAGAVKEMVVAVLNKEYVVDSCMSLITSSRTPENTNVRPQELETQKFCQGLINALIVEKTVESEARVRLAVKDMTSKVSNDAEKILGCIAPAGVFSPEKRDQLFADANSKVNGALTTYQAVIAQRANVSDFRTLLGQIPPVRAAMAVAADSSDACN